MNARIPRVAVALFVSLVSITPLACKSAQSTEQDAGGTNTSSMTDILAAEIEKAGLEGLTAMEVVQRLRPSFLRNSVGAGRYAGLAVTVNGGQMDDVGGLAKIHASDVESIRYFTATQAGLRFGFRVSGPVILVTTKPPAKG